MTTADFTRFLSWTKQAWPLEWKAEAMVLSFIHDMQVQEVTYSNQYSSGLHKFSPLGNVIRGSHYNMQFYGLFAEINNLIAKNQQENEY